MRARSILLVLALGVATACAPDFDPASKIQSVRILATRADKPYAKPGDTIELEMLATDARKDKTRPMSLFWIPAPCINPQGDAYYNCYPTFQATLKTGVDLTPQLVSGPKLTVHVPDDTLAHTGSTQGGTSFGTAVVFSMACAGHVEFVGVSAASPQSIPFGCFDSGGQRLGPDDFVFAFSRMFVFADRQNKNPVIDAFTFDGQPVDLAAGITIDHCATANAPASQRAPKCPTKPIDVAVPPESQEQDPSAGGRESLWVSYYLTDGKVKTDLRLLYDVQIGRVPKSEDDLEAPAEAGEHTLWAVVHDNRGGVNWIQVPMHVR
ncbi:MAG: hypothetical protein JWM74_3976 [Myxococcaceae bacterium]|nr:hypothetical protein [Myxococcaceae bacterium]